VRAGPTDAERPWRIIDNRPVSYDFDVDAKGDNAEFHLAQKRNGMSHLAPECKLNMTVREICEPIHAWKDKSLIFLGQR
jgi:hypothetical protein